MNIRFSWKRDADGYTPVSKSDLLNRDGVSLLDCLLMDSGGLPYLETIFWLNEGLRRINTVASGSSEFSEWGRETWAVEFRNNKAKIYSLHDEKYFQSLSLEGFSTALRQWTDFVQSMPNESETRHLSIDDETQSTLE